MINFKCRICGSTGGYLRILETETTLAANVSDTPSKNMSKYPLHVVRCNNCGHVQLRETLDSSFYNDYLYTPSFASGFDEYIDWFVSMTGKRMPNRERKVIEIGSSNGLLLKKFQEDNWEVLGVEPSITLSKKAEEIGVKTYNGFFTKNTAGEISKLIGKPNVVVFRHVLEHLDKLNDIIEAAAGLVENGLLLIEVPYLKKIINENQFYGFFHEHLSYFSVSLLARLLSGAGLHIHHVYENSLEGGSILVVANINEQEDDDDNVGEYLSDEVISLSDEKIQKFSDDIQTYVERIKTRVSEALDAGKRVAAWGAGQRGCTLISMCSFQSEDLCYVVDVNKNYWWKYIPGTDIQIVSPEYYKENFVDEILIFATGYADSIIRENPKYGLMGGKFVKII